MAWRRPDRYSRGKGQKFNMLYGSGYWVPKSSTKNQIQNLDQPLLRQY